MELEWDEKRPYEGLIEKPRIFEKTTDDLAGDVFENVSTREEGVIQVVYDQIKVLKEEIQNSKENLLQYVVVATDNVEKPKSNSKRKKTRGRLIVAENEPLGIAYNFADGENKTCVICRNVSGTVKVCNLKIGNWGNDNLFAIYFPMERILVMGDKSRVKKESLMNAFIRAGVVFEESVPKDDIAESLYNFFAARIEFAKDVWELPTHQGWSENLFFDANCPPIIERQEFLKFPIFKKYFTYVIPTSEAFESYFKLLTGIKSSYARAVVMILPFYGIIRSLIAENMNLYPIIANFLMLNEKNPRRICELVQVFNRQEIGVNSLDISSKEVDEMINQSNDEVVLVDAMYEEEDSLYYKEKVSNNALYLANVFLEKRSCKNRKRTGGKATLAVFSSRRILLGGCINIIVTEEFWTKNKPTENANQIVEAVLTAFVEFIKTNFVEVKQIIRKQREKEDGRTRVMVVMQEILSKFFIAAGFEMHEYAKFSPDFKFEDVLQDVVDTEELMENFRICIKRQISKFFIVPKGKIYEKNWIYYDKEWLYFPTNVFNRILGMEGMFTYKEDILLDLYEEKYLRKDMEGFSRKLMISGARFETYQIQRDFFDVPGEVSIIDLGKEPEDEG